MMRKFVVLAAVLLAPSVAHAETFNGAYVGVEAGLQSTTIDSAQLFNGLGVGTPTVNDKNSSGATFGVMLGYDFKATENFVIGAEFAGKFNTGSNNQMLTFPGTPPSNVSLDYKNQALFEVTARAGVLVGGNTLVYARGGYANSKLKVDIAGPGGASTQKGNNNGWLVGGGIEHAFGEKLSARIEYKHFEMKGPIKRNDVEAGVAYHF